MGLKAFNLLQKAGKYIRTYADEAISMSKKAGIAPIPINNTNKNLVTDVVEVASRKTNLKQRLIDGVVTQNTKSAGIKIPKGNFRAPRAGFEESLRAYKDIIKNNQDEIKGICAKYQKGLINEHEFANEYARFLSSAQKQRVKRFVFCVTGSEKSEPWGETAPMMVTEPSLSHSVFI